MAVRGTAATGDPSTPLCCVRDDSAFLDAALRGDSNSTLRSGRRAKIFFDFACVGLRMLCIAQTLVLSFQVSFWHNSLMKRTLRRTFERSSRPAGLTQSSRRTSSADFLKVHVPCGRRCAIPSLSGALIRTDNKGKIAQSLYFLLDLEIRFGMGAFHERTTTKQRRKRGC
jgi:hypothetical protein